MGVGLITGFTSTVDRPGLQVTINSGTATISGSLVLFPRAAISLANNSTNYVYLNFSSGLIETATSGFLANSWPICTAVTSNGIVTQLTDSRPDIFGGSGGGGSTPPGGANTNLQYNNAGAFGGFADGTATQVLHGGRTFGPVNLATDVTGILPPANGGESGPTPPGGANTNLQYNNAGAFGGFADGTATQVLHGGRTFGPVNLATDVTGVLPPANGGESGPTPPGGANTNLQYNNAGAFGGFADGTATQVLHGGRTFGPVNLATDVTGVLPPANGGESGPTPPGGANTNLQYNNAGAFGGFADGTATQVLHGGRTFGAVNLATDVTGILPPANVGAGGATTNLQYNNAGVLGGFADGTSTQVLHGGRTFGAVNLATDVTGILPPANVGAGGATTNLQYNNAGVLGGFADGTSTQVLHGGRTFGAVNLATDVTGILPPANGGVAQVNSAGQGYLVGGFVRCPHAAPVTLAVSPSANQVFALQMVVPFAVTIDKIALRMGTSGGTGTKFNTAIYDKAGTTKLVEASFNAGSTTSQSLTITAVTLNPGTYWFAWSAANITMQAVGYTAPGTSEVFQAFGFQGLAANAMVSNVMPSTLGAISSNSAAANVPLCLFYN